VKSPDASVAGSNVIRLRPAEFPLSNRRRDYSKPTCFHSGMALVDGLARTIECSVCGVALDPIDVLTKIANDADWTVTLRTEKMQLSKEIEALKEERAKLKGSVRGLKERRTVTK
jgi:hypothetical protein